jgi:hypothetical protein
MDEPIELPLDAPTVPVRPMRPTSNAVPFSAEEADEYIRETSKFDFE